MSNKPSDRKQDFNIDSLLEQLDSRTSPDTDKAATSKAQVKAHWLQMVQKQKLKRQKKYIWAIAASMMLATTLALFTFIDTNKTNELVVLATITDFSGDVSLKQSDGSWSGVQNNEKLLAGANIQTASQSYLTLKLTDGSEIRVAPETELTAQVSEIDLKRGQLYHDTDDAYSADPLTIRTNHGLVQHIGTRYLVSNDNNQVKVAVRSGQVKIIADAQSQKEHILDSNQMIELTDNHPGKLSSLDSHDDFWEWTFVAQPEFELDGKSLYDFVKWYAHQTGLSINWNELESQTKRVRLHGNIKNISSEKAIETVFLSTQFGYSIIEGVLQITGS